MKFPTGQTGGSGRACSRGWAGLRWRKEYPFRDITTAVVWGAGGGTDAINRMIMARNGAAPAGLDQRDQPDRRRRRVERNGLCHESAR